MAKFDEMNKEQARLQSPKRWLIYAQVGFIGLLVATSLWYTMSTGSKIAKQYAPLADAAMEIKLQTTTAHLRFEEVISDDQYIDIDTVWQFIDKAEWYAEAMIKGDTCEKGQYTPLNDSALNYNIEEVIEKIKAFRTIAEERFANANQASIGSKTDQQFDFLFESLIHQADEVETALQSAMKRDIKRFQTVQIALIVFCFILTAAIGSILHRFQKKQIKNLIMLDASKQRLQAGEQQLTATNQQLKASNLQLAAGEQQLRASNQQLQAGEQQLRASNQQLQASEQQLKAAVHELRQSQRKLALHIQHTPLAVIQWDADFLVTDWNRAAEVIFGFTHDEAIGKHAAGLIVPESAREHVDQIWKDLLAQRGGDRSTNECLTKDKQTITCEWYNTPLIGDDGRTIGVASLVLDITKRVQAEQSMKDLAHILEQSLNEIYILDYDSYRFIQVNRGARENIGYTQEELAKMTPIDIKPELTDDAFILSIEPLRNGSKESIIFDTVHERKNGSRYDVEVHLQVSEYFNKPVFVAMIIDITETNRLKKLESRAARLETAGTIAGQVAHDFNNLLAPIVAYPEFIHEALPHDNKAHAYLDAIEGAAMKIADINQDLLAMGRRGHYNQEVLNLNRIVLHAINEMESRTETVTVEMELCEELMKIKGGAAQIHRMLTNLLVNANDATGEIGKIIVKTENYYADDTSISFGRVPKGEYVKLTVSDNGCGIPNNILQKITDPFFSTKMADKQRGSGLGLSVVDAVIKDHGGHLDLSSKIGQGTSFYVYFPVTREDINGDETEILSGGTETILVVDDDDIQREVTTQLLTRLGYDVNSVESGEKAVELLSTQTFELIILDMVMPEGIDGAETFRQLLKVNPGQKAIILSGFSESDRVFEAQKLGAGAFIKKPVTKISIAAAVRTELNRNITKT